MENGLDHEGSVLHHLLLIIVLEAFSGECKTLTGKHPCGVCFKGVGFNSIFGTF